MSPLHHTVLLASLWFQLILAKLCHHIINVQTGQYLQAANIVDPTTNYYQFAWLSHDKQRNSLWFVERYEPDLRNDTFFMVNMDTGEYLTVHPYNDLAYVLAENVSSWMPRDAFLFRLNEVGKEGEIVSSMKNYSLYAVSVGVQGSYVRSNSRCGLDSCQWRFEGYDC